MKLNLGYISVFMVLFLLFGCSKSEVERRRELFLEKQIAQREQQSWDACIKLGGVPFASYSGKLMDCKVLK